MQLHRHRSTGERWQILLIVVAVCSLTLSLATRFWAPAPPSYHLVKSIDGPSVDPKQQHLDRDAAHWVAPGANFSIIEPVTFEIQRTLASPPLPEHTFSDSLYNRPPPSRTLL